MTTTSYPKLTDLDLIALDLDGTVICSQGKSPISERTKAAIKAITERGVRVTFVTGRTEDYAAPIARKFDLTEPMVTYNGARIYSVAEQRTLYQAVVESQVATQLATWLQSTDEVVACYLDRDGKLRLVQTRCSGRPAHDDYLFGTPRFLVGQLESEIGHPEAQVSKMIVSTQRKLDEEIAEKFGPVVKAVRTHPELIEILPPGVSKGTGVERLCQLMGVERSRVLAVGDQANDIPTFEVCGYSVAMGEAPDAVKAAAQFTTATFEEDGCAKALERLL